MSGVFASTGRLYGDRQQTPVPFPAYRCKSTARDTSKAAHTHLCKITVDHKGDHRCICSKAWKQLAEVVS